MARGEHTATAPRREIGGRCPTCGERSVREHRPFCSRRCADIDLGRWLKGNYRVPTDEAPEEGPPEEKREPEE
jgi:endogenous inhibitor of DNA gyrase (YacG/DUF329 family)